MNEFKPCPFCGGKPRREMHSGNERNAYADCVSYVCTGCGCRQSAMGDTSKPGYADNTKIEAQALEKWNRRV